MLEGDLKSRAYLHVKFKMPDGHLKARDINLGGIGKLPVSSYLSSPSNSGPNSKTSTMSRI